MKQPTISRYSILVLFVCCAALLTTSIYADACSDDTSCSYLTCRAGVKPAPSSLWGEIRPVDTDTLPSTRDNTSFSQIGTFDSSHPYWNSLDIANGYIFTALNSGFQIWDANSNPAQPVLLKTIDGRHPTAGGFPEFPANPEDKFPVRDIAVPPGRDDLVAVVAAGSVGMTIFDTTDKFNPRALYQDYGDGKLGTAAYATTVGATSVAYMAGSSTGVTMYDMTRAKSNGTTCKETTPVTACAGVYLGKLGSRQNVGYLHGTGNYVALSSGAVARGVEIWNVSTPTAPIQVLSALSSTIVYGVAMWNDGGFYYLATREEPGARLRIYDVSCIATSSCTGPSLVSTVELNDTGNSQNFITFSRANGVPFLHMGSDRACSGAERREWLFDVSNPTSPRDITPSGYWNWYSRGTATGFNFAGMRRAKFNGNYLYRAAFSYFDIHQKTGGSSLFANFNWSPAEIYAGTSVTFSDLSSGSPTSWSWSFPGGNPSSSTVRNPVVAFASPGTYSVSLQACTSSCQSVSRSVTVLSAGASVTGISASKLSVNSCESVTFTATGVTGQAPITYNWALFKDNAIYSLICGNVNPCSWTPTSAVPSGTYSAKVIVSNPANPSGTIASTNFTLNSASLGFTTSAPTNDAFTAATVKFHANSTGATEWSWDFDDDNDPGTALYGGFSSDSNLGANPSHTYTTNGTKYVRVRIRDCSGTILESNTLVITISASTLSAGFQAQGCLFNNCSFEANLPVTFIDSSGGSPTSWSYDWNNTGSSSSGCSFGSPFASPQTTHTWSTTGTYRPCLKVTKGTQSATVVHSAITITPAVPPGITITGPLSGWPSTNMQFSATAGGCVPSSSWSWNVGDASGSSVTNAISLSWATPGMKQISVTNSGCAGLTGTVSVFLTSPTSAPLNAAFTYSPSTVSTGQQVTFDGTSSSGGPNVFTWQVTGPTNSGYVDGAMLKYTFNTAGTYNVALTISKPGTGNGCVLGLCSATTSKSVTVGAPSGGCNGDPTALCLGTNGRFKVTTAWRTPQGTTGTGTPIRLTSDTGYFWFFNSSNIEMLVKALDGCAIGGNYWVFQAGLTNVEVTTTVTDTLTSRVRTYTNVQGNAFVPVQDTAAFSCNTGAKESPAWIAPVSAQNGWTETVETIVPTVATCTTSGTDLCLNNGRFKLNATWRTPQGTTGNGTAVQLTQDTGYFWFFNDTNVELITKVLDGCGLNGAFWAFAAGLTNVEVDLSVTDLKSGVVKHYTNTQGTAFQPVQDTSTLNTCP